MNRLIGFLGALGAGAALMYFLDPERGRTRRALIRDKAAGLSHDVQDAIGSKSRDLRNRAQGLLHEAKSTFSPTPDEPTREGMGQREGGGI